MQDYKLSRQKGSNKKAYLHVFPQESHQTEGEYMLIVKVVEALFKFLISVYQLTDIASLEKSIDI